MVYVFNREELEKLCKEWQTTLGLSDWEVKVLICRKDDMFEPNSQGGCKAVLPKKTAIIKILDSIDYDSELWPQDTEQTLVHELVHILLWPLEWEEEFKGLRFVAMEQATDTMAKALVNTKRNNRKLTA